MGGIGERDPALAPHDSRNPTECNRNGSTTSSTITAYASTRSRDAGRPDERREQRDRRPSPTRAAPTARSASSSRTAARSRARATVRAPAASRRSSGPNEREHERDVLARDREQMREAGVAVVGRRRRRGRARVSPSRKPASSARGVGASGRGAAQHDDRGAVSATANNAPGGRSASTSAPSRRATACRHSARSSKPRRAQRASRPVER